MEGVTRNGVRLLPHNPAWSDEFLRTRDMLLSAWGENVLAVEHVGSTAIPSVPAKPVLDAAVLLRSMDLLDIAALTGRGYEYCGPQGGSGRVLFVLRGENEISLHHIHCGAGDNRDLLRQIAFRDYLIAHPDAAREYAALKQRLARQYPDNRAAYTAGKSEFILGILAAASPDSVAQPNSPE